MSEQSKNMSMEEFLEKQKQIQSHIQNQNHENSILIAYSTQTGVSELLAYRTTDILIRSGFTVDCKPLWWFKDASMLESYLYVLFIVSSTGIGKIAQRTYDFFDRLEEAKQLNIEYSLLALGDSRFKTFCEGGYAFDKILKQYGAREFMPLLTADAQHNQTEEDWQKWLNKVATTKNLKLAEFEDNEHIETECEFEFLSRTRLDNPNYNLKEVYSVELKLLTDCCFRSGDILSLLPLKKTKDKRERYYSIGSNRDDTNIVRLTVALENDGLCSNYLIHTLNSGDKFKGTIVSHPHFNIPLYSAEPIIMVARDTGIAPFRGFLEDIERRPRVTWLFFANTHKNGNDYYRSYWEESYKKGKLIYLNFIFDDDAQNDQTLTETLVQSGQKLFKLLDDESALIYVCGHTDLLNNEVKKALTQIYEKYGPGLFDAQAWYEQLLLKKQIRVDIHNTFV